MMEKFEKHNLIKPHSRNYRKNKPLSLEENRSEIKMFQQREFQVSVCSNGNSSKHI